MTTLNPLRAALALALFMGLVHAGWAALVASGFAQPLIDFIFRLHFLSQPFDVQPFDLTTAAMLIGVTAGVGLIFGFVLALVWNALIGKGKA